MEILKILIADDEELARRRIVRLLEAVEAVEVVAQCKSGSEVLAQLGRPEVEVDLLMLDIRMPGLSGIETAALLPEDAPHVVFTTAHQDHAVEAFDVGAADYLLKPVEAARLAVAVQRARERLMGSESNALSGRLPVHTRSGIVLVDPSDITHALFDGELVTLHTERGDLLCDFSLAHLEERLGSGPFVRVHRRAILNLEKVRRLEPQPSGGYVARVPGDAPVPVSRQAARRLRRRFGL